MEPSWDEVLEHMKHEGRKGLEYLTTRYTPVMVSEALHSVALALGFYLAAVMHEKQDPQHVAGRGLAVYSNSLWERLREWEVVPCDVLAWTTRNLMEVHFWTKFISGSPENAAGFLREDKIDQRELWQCYLKTTKTRHNEDFGRYLIEALAEGISGKRVSIETEDKLLFKECSKYIHPSAWLIADCELRMNDRYSRYKFLAFSLHYLSQITTLLMRSHPETQFLLTDEERV